MSTDFFRMMLPYARQISERTGLDPRLVMAQSALETGYGQSAPGNNFFGIKSHGREGGNTLATTEVVNGTPATVNDSFRSYGNVGQSADDYASFLLSNPRYRDTLSAHGLDAQIEALGKSGYATDPQYSAKVRQIAQGINLDSPELIGSDALAAVGLIQEQPQVGRAETGLLSGDTIIPGGPDVQQEPKGLLGGLLSEDKRDFLISALEGMTLNPNQALIKGAQGRIKDRRTEQAKSAQANRTAEWLKSQGREDLAQAVANGSIDGKTAVGIAMTPPDDPRTALQKNYEFFLKQGMSPEDAMQAVRAGTTVNVNNNEGGVTDKFYENIDKQQADMFGSLMNTGITAPGRLAQVDELERLLGSSPSGAKAWLSYAAGNFGIETEGLSDLQAAQAIINRLVPEQRPAGSGPMSDADLELFKQSLPRLINTPDGNRTIARTMRGLITYEAQQADIATKVATRQMTPAEGLKALQELVNPLQAMRKRGATTIGGYSIEEVQ